MSVTTQIRRATTGLTTPARMMAALAVIAALSVAAAITALLVVGDIRATVQTIGSDAEPSVVAAQVLRARLAGMESEALADALNDNGAASGTSLAFRDDLAAVNERIVAASRNITYGESEAAPLRGLVGELDHYLESLAETRWMARDNAWLAVQRARWSSRLLNDFVMPQAAALEQANLAPLEQRYAAYRDGATLAAATGLAPLAVLLAALVGTQAFLLRRTRRLVNLPLAAATLLVLLIIAGFAAAMAVEQADMRAAKQDAFDSIHALYGAKAAASGLNAARSMWLLDPATRAESAARFTEGARALLAIDATDIKATGAIVDGLTRAVEIERAGRPDDANKAAPKLGGLLGDELGNITFGVAERQAATEAVIALLNYLETDREIRRLELARRHIDAVSLATSGRQGGSMAAFATLDQALDRTIAVNEAEFARRTGDAVSLLGWLPVATGGALAMAVALAAAGLWQRWREYR